MANASGVRVRQGFGQPNIRLLLTGKVYLALRIPLTSCLAGYSTSGSASGVRATEKRLGGVEDKNKAIIARFDIG